MQQFKEAQGLFQKNSMNLPMVEHEDKLNVMLEYLQLELEKDKKELQIIRQEIIHESYIQSSINEDTSSSYVEELVDFTRHFRQIAQTNISESNDLSKQAEALKNEKIKLKKSVNLLDHKVAELEKMLGVGLTDQQPQDSY